MTSNITRILYVGSDPEFSDSVRADFDQRSGEFACTYATSGKQALEFVRGQQFDLLISEYGLFDMTGVRLCRSIRELDGSIPILIYASVYRDANHEGAMGAGANAYILKSDGISNLFSTIRRLTRKSEQVPHRNHARRSSSII